MRVSSSTELKQLGILPLWFVIFNPENKSSLVSIIFNEKHFHVSIEPDATNEDEQGAAFMLPFSVSLKS